MHTLNYNKSLRQYHQMKDLGKNKIDETEVSICIKIRIMFVLRYSKFFKNHTIFP